MIETCFWKALLTCSLLFISIETGSSYLIMFFENVDEANRFWAQNANGQVFDKLQISFTKQVIIDKALHIHTESCMEET